MELADNEDDLHDWAQAHTLFYKLDESKSKN